MSDRVGPRKMTIPRNTTLSRRNGRKHDSASRLQSVRTGTNSAAYSYIANSPLVGQIYFTNGSTLRMTTSKTFDFLNRLTSISSVPSAASVVSFEYSYNAANQRTLRREADQSLWRFDYDPLGQPRAASVRHMKETGQNRGLTPFMPFTKELLP